MTTDEIAIVTALLARMRAFAAEPGPIPGHGYGTRRRIWDEQNDHGPRFSSSDAFDGSAAGRKRCQRGLARLEADGLVTLWRPNGERVTNVKLTPTGLIVAEDLAGEAAVRGLLSLDPSEGSQGAIRAVEDPPANLPNSAQSVALQAGIDAVETEPENLDA